MSRMFPWKATFLRHHYQLATGECTFKRAVIRRRRRGLPVRGFQGSAVASETLSESQLALSVFNCIVSSEQSLSFSESAKSFGGEKTFCFGNIWRFLLFPFYLPFDSKMCFPDTITRSEVKKILIKRQKKLSPQQKLKDISKEFGIICLYNDFIEDEWFVDLGKVEVLSKYNQTQIISKHWLQLKNAPLFSTKIQKLKLSEFGYFLFLCFLLRRKSMRGKVHALVVIKSKLSWVIQIRQTVLGKEST